MCPEPSSLLSPPDADTVVPLACSNEAKHRERFAVRAKSMTLDPGANKYIRNIRHIRVIQVRTAALSCEPPRSSCYA